MSDCNNITLSDRTGAHSAWRLIAYAEHDAAMNMAIDESILEAHKAGLVPPTLRLYGFSPSAVSIGYAQKLSAESVQRITAAGFDLVRRPTGGRAVLHANDLTYSFIGTAFGSKEKIDRCNQARTSQAGTECSALFHAGSAFLSPSIAAAYKQICAGLIKALQLLRIEVEVGASDTAYRHLHDCFQATTNADLHYGGKKLVGSAQLRRGTAVLQHGSVLLNQDQTAMERLLSDSFNSTTGKIDDAGTRIPQLAAPVGQSHSAHLPGYRALASVTKQKSAVKENEQKRHANLFDIAGQEYTTEQLESAIKAGFEEAFNVKLEFAKLTDAEEHLANTLRRKYSQCNAMTPGAS